jgi:DNA invertase Pin-like site-specific DNA recombinase
VGVVIRVAGYVRVSRVGGRNGDSFQSPKQQADAIRALCQARGYDVSRVDEELDASGGTMDREKLQALIADIKANRIDGIVVYRLDRFARTLEGALKAFREITEAGGFVLAVEGGIDTSASAGPIGKFVVRLLFSLAEMELDMRAEGFELAKLNAIERGVHIAGTVPVGYVKLAKATPLVVDPKPAAAVRAAFRLRAKGAKCPLCRRLAPVSCSEHSLAEVARMLDTKLPGGPSGEGAWMVNTVKRMLRNRTYLGEARQGKHVKEKAHEAIVTPREFEIVQALDDRREPASSVTVSLLAGVARCAECGYALDRQRVGMKYLVYRCRGKHAGHGKCEAPAQAMQHALDSLVEEAVLANVAAKRADRIEARDEIDVLQAKLSAARSKRSPFEDADYVAVLGIVGATRALLKLDREIAQLERELSEQLALADHGPFTGGGSQSVSELWAQLSTDERREVIQSSVEAVVVWRAPRGTPLAERTRIYWRGEQLPFAKPSRGRKKKTNDEIKEEAAA